MNTLTQDEFESELNKYKVKLCKAEDVLEEFDIRYCEMCSDYESDQKKCSTCRVSCNKINKKCDVCYRVYCDECCEKDMDHCSNDLECNYCHLKECDNCWNSTKFKYLSKSLKQQTNAIFGYVPC
jgi:hypothetical protein